MFRYGTEVIAAEMPLFFAIYRLPTLRMVALCGVFSIMDASVMFYLFHQSYYFFARLFITLSTGVISSLLSRSIGVVGMC